MDNNNKRTFINIVATITLAIFIFASARLLTELDAIKDRLRAVEIKVAQIATELGIQDGSQMASGRPLAGSEPAEKDKRGG